jgi:hypothetical protein
MTHLVPVVYKRSRVAGKMPNSDSQLNFHTFHCFGGVLNPNANHGKGYYVRRVMGQDERAVLSTLTAIATGQKGTVDAHSSQTR